MIVRIHHVDGTVVGPFANVDSLTSGLHGHTFELHFKDRRAVHTIPREYVRSIEIVDGDRQHHFPEPAIRPLGTDTIVG